MTPVLVVLPWALVAVLLVSMLLMRRASSRAQRTQSDQLASLARTAEERATALDYIVRARVVDYAYEYVGYRVMVGHARGDEVERVMVFGPPHHKDIICKRITLAEGQKTSGVTSVHEFSFEAAIHRPLPDLFVEEGMARIDPYDESAWQFESHPWVLDVPPDESKETRAILVFTPMISDTRRLKISYRWPNFFPRLRGGALTARGHFSILKKARLLEFMICLPENAPAARLSLHPPSGRDPVEATLRDDALVCALTDALRGTYHYVITLERPLVISHTVAPEVGLG